MQPKDIRQFRKATKKNKRFQNKFFKKSKLKLEGKRQCSGQKNHFLRNYNKGPWGRFRENIRPSK
jgi:hypothetical protein